MSLSRRVSLWYALVSLSSIIVVFFISLAQVKVLWEILLLETVSLICAPALLNVSVTKLAFLKLKLKHSQECLLHSEQIDCNNENALGESKTRAS